jgi:hypothetical protein
MGRKFGVKAKISIESKDASIKGSSSPNTSTTSQILVVSQSFSCHFLGFIKKNVLFCASFHGSKVELM